MFGLTFLFVLVAVAGAWRRTDESDALVRDSFHAASVADLSTKTFAARLDVPPSQLSNMASGLEAGPGFARFGRLSAAWWIPFIEQVAARFGLVVIREARLKQLVSRFDQFDLRMAKMTLDADDFKERVG